MGRFSSSDEGEEKKLIRKASINLAIELTDKEKEFREKLYPGKYNYLFLRAFQVLLQLMREQ